MTTRFLDIDLDAFVDPIAYWPSGGRLDDSEYEVWTEARLRRFLEVQCGLNKQAKIPGAFVEQHDGAFDVLRDLHPSSGPLDLTHIDGHADLGMGDPSWVYMIKELMQLPMAERGSPMRGHEGVNPGSWMAYAAAAGWIERILFVHPDDGAEDLPGLYFRNCDSQTKLLEMKRFHLKDLGRGTPNYERLYRTTPAQCDPPIPFSTVTLDTFQSPAPFAQGLLCRSPDYTPARADALIDIIGDYIRF
jgi:hypothetical protein